MRYMNNQQLFKIVTCVLRMQPRGSKNKTEVRKWKQQNIMEAYGLPGRWVEEGEAFFFCRGVWQWETMYLGWSHILSGPVGVRIKTTSTMRHPKSGYGDSGYPREMRPLTAWWWACFYRCSGLEIFMSAYGSGASSPVKLSLQMREYLNAVISVNLS